VKKAAVQSHSSPEFRLYDSLLVDSVYVLRLRLRLYYHGLYRLRNVTSKR